MVSFIVACSTSQEGTLPIAIAGVCNLSGVRQNFGLPPRLPPPSPPTIAIGRVDDLTSTGAENEERRSPWTDLHFV